MLDHDWLVEKLEISGTYHHSDGLSSVFYWEGPPIRSTSSLQIQNGEVVSSGGPVEFLTPSRAEDMREKVDNNPERYTAHEDAPMTLYSIRTTDNTSKTYFIPSESGVNLRSGVEEGDLVASGDDVYFRRLMFNRSPTGEYSTDTHTHVLHQLGEQVPPVMKTGDEIDYGVNEQYTKLNKIEEISGPL